MNVIYWGDLPKACHCSKQAVRPIHGHVLALRGGVGIPTDRDQRSWVFLNNPKNTLPLKENPKNTSRIPNKHSPTVTLKIRGKTAPYVTSEIRKMIRQRDFLKAKANKTGSKYLWQAYQQMRNKAGCRLRKSKQDRGQ